MEDPNMSYELVVKIPFDDYQIGDTISDPRQVQAILTGELAAFVLKRNV